MEGTVSRSICPTSSERLRSVISGEFGYARNSPVGEAYVLMIVSHYPIGWKSYPNPLGSISTLRIMLCPIYS
jgi:hypothetical protein